ncbi:glycosyl transferase family protein [Microbulbifer guangxiensis]|uniref:glycosyl transferase family protein n=1 Tax=Microbulbifer guangxiensis TaxID=2904249 RepID=UPI001F22B71D|nr:glycosyl transferase family protein [Microbulbifer guangxiensis]
MTDVVTSVAIYLYALKWVFIVVACAILICSLDDLFIDLYYWKSQLKKRSKRRRRSKVPSVKTLLSLPEKPLAIMVPAWQEVGVVGGMAQLIAENIDYENYHIFIGTYPNDQDTQNDVDSVCALYPNIHKVVCVNPGPTCKADCLNNILKAIGQFEQQARVEFAGYILHDAEDVIHPMELKLFNSYLPRYGLIQIPVYPFARAWHQFTSGHYMDEFAELHGKDVLVREAISGQVPSAGVGTCFNRKAIDALFRQRKKSGFNTESLTEDYDIGFQLKQLGFRETFVRCPAVELDSASGDNRGWSRRQRSVVCIREYFPDQLSAAIRQKSRWIIGIAFQGFKSIGWQKSLRMNYFLMRDRRCIVTNLLGFLGVIILFHLLLVAVYEVLFPEGYKFLTNFSSDPTVAVLVSINLLLLANRLSQRFIFVSQYYGYWQGFLSMPRMLWGNVINFFACLRAIRQVTSASSVRKVAWDKTTHDFPVVRSYKKTDGDLVAQLPGYQAAWLSTEVCVPDCGLSIFQQLILSGKCTSEDVAKLKARTASVETVVFDWWKLDELVLESMPVSLIWKFSVIPLSVSEDSVLLASEDALSPVTMATISRRLGKKVTYGIAPPGHVSQAIRTWFGQPLEKKKPTVSRQTHQDKVLPLTQVLLKDYLVRTGKVSQAVMSQALVELTDSRHRIEDLLLTKGIMSQADLTRAEEEIEALPARLSKRTPLNVPQLLPEPQDADVERISQGA